MNIVLSLTVITLSLKLLYMHLKQIDINRTI